MTDVTRHFATLGPRQVHYRRAGTGAPVLLLHQTPTSSAELLPLLRHLAARFTVIAPDMPGYGVSDPLAPAIPMSIALLADELAQFMSELGIQAAGIYGFHTGASLATAFARRYPQRVSVAIAEGLLCLDTGERDALLAHYLEPFEPRWDGGHLAWLWTRLKDQSVFFPWYERSAHTRLALDAAGTAQLAAKAEDWLRSGAQYPRAYRAAMEYDPGDDLRHLTTPYHVIAQRGDPLAAHLPRVPKDVPYVHAQLLDDGTAAKARIDDILNRHCFGLPQPPPARTTPLLEGVWQHYVGRAGAQLRVLRAGRPEARPLVLLHAAQSSAPACALLLFGFARARSVYGIELPGHGESDRARCEGDVPIAYLAARVRAVLDELGVGAADFVGLGAGATICVECLRDPAARPRSLTLIAPIDLSDDPLQCEALATSYVQTPPDSYGGYLLQAWHMVRDQQMFFPWFERRRAFGIAAPELAPDVLQARTVDHLLSGAAGVDLARCEARYSIRERMHGIDVPLLWAASSCCPRFRHSQALANRAASFLALAQPMGGWAKPILAALDR